MSCQLPYNYNCKYNYILNLNPLVQKKDTHMQLKLTNPCLGGQAHSEGSHEPPWSFDTFLFSPCYPPLALLRSQTVSHQQLTYEGLVHLLGWSRKTHPLAVERRYFLFNVVIIKM